MANLTGKKFGGRQKGTPNKRSSIPVVQRLVDADLDPFLELVKIIRKPEASIELQTKILCELAQYVAPKRKAIDHSSEDGTATAHGVHEIVVRVVKPTPIDEEQLPTIEHEPTSTNVTRLSH